IGDYIKLETGQDGYVDDIGWRSTTLRTLMNNLVVIPNNKIAQSIVTNFSLPERPIGCPLQIGVAYDSDPSQVERVLGEVASAAAGMVHGMLQEPAPFVRFHPGFGDFSLDFTLTVWVGDYADQIPVLAEIRKRILRRFDDEGILMPSQPRAFELRRA